MTTIRQETRVRLMVEPVQEPRPATTDPDLARRAPSEALRRTSEPWAVRNADADRRRRRRADPRTSRAERVRAARADSRGAGNSARCRAPGLRTWYSPSSPR